jgi:hypothetical protein
MINNKTKFFGIYLFKCLFENDSKGKELYYNILIIGNKVDNKDYLITYFITGYEDTEMESVNYSYTAKDEKEANKIIKEIASQIKSNKNKFILISEDEVSYDSMTNILEKWKQDIIIINKDNV